MSFNLRQLQKLDVENKWALEGTHFPGQSILSAAG
jgi:hypothetical protein